MSLTRPEFECEWLDAVFLHYEAPPAALASIAPAPLHLHDGSAYFTLVAFGMRGFRPVAGHGWPRWLTAPIATYPLLNLRTYVESRPGERAIYFIREWVANRIACCFGPRTFGLPYRSARIEDEAPPVIVDSGSVNFRRSIVERNGRSSAHALRFAATARLDDLAPAKPGSLTSFLLERYTAYTMRGRVIRRFTIEHEPWPQVPIDVEIEQDDLLRSSFEWFSASRLIAAHYSPRVHVSRITWPERP